VREVKRVVDKVKEKWSLLLAPFFLFFLTFIVYLHNNSSSVYGGDVGDMLSAIAVKGIPHPSGYPLFTMLGILFSYIPLDQTLAWKAGLISVMFSSLSIVLIYLIITELTGNKLLAVISSFILAFFYPFWLYAELAEVFALNSFFILILFLLGILYLKKKKTYYFYLLVFFAGLSLTNNQVIVLIFPSLCILASTNLRKIFKFRTFLLCTFFFLAGLLPYFYIPIAASFNPPINWLTSRDSKDVIKLILRLDYDTKPSGNPDFYLRYLPLKAYSTYLFLQLTIPVIFTSILGMIFLINKKNITLFISLFLGFFLTGPFFVFYFSTPLTSGFSMGVLERFYQISAIFLIIFSSFGILFIIDKIMKFLVYILPAFTNKQYYKKIFIAVFSLIPLVMLVNNFPKTDLHDMFSGEYAAEDLLSPLPENSVLFVTGDTLLFNSLYLQHAKGFRKDISVINMGRLAYDETFTKEKKEIQRRNPKMTEDVLNVTVVTSLAQKRPVFSMLSIKHKDKKHGELKWEPYALVLHLIDKTDKTTTEESFLDRQQKFWSLFHFPEKDTDKKLSAHGLSLTSIPALYSVAFVNIGNYLVSEYNDTEKAKKYYQKAIKIAPDETGGYKGLGYYYLNINDCKKAEENMSKVIYLSPMEKNAYLLLYVTYENCYKDKKKAKLISDKFYYIFNVTIAEELKNKES